MNGILAKLVHELNKKDIESCPIHWSNLFDFVDSCNSGTKTAVKTGYKSVSSGLLRMTYLRPKINSMGD